MLLDIIIPQYHEKEDKLSLLLGSINNQIGFDLSQVRVTIVNDKSEPEYIPTREFLDTFKNIHIDVLVNEVNGGCGPARQYAIDRTDGEYITFIDADDMLYSSDTLHKVFYIINKYPGKDVYYGKVLEEHIVNNQYSYSPLETGLPWMHGKYFRRSAIEARGARFAPDLFYHEDSAFNGLMLTENNNVLKFDDLVYIWRCNINSMTRVDQRGYLINTLDQFIKAYTIIQDNNEEKFKNISAMTYLDVLFKLYYTMQLPVAFEEKYTERRPINERACYEFFAKYRYNLNKLTNVQVSNIKRTQYNNACAHGLLLEKETFEQFYNRLITQYEQK